MGPLETPVEITRCGHVVVADAVMVNDLVCDTGQANENAVGNNWQNNKCQRKEGAGIPQCTILFLDGFEH